MANPHYDPKNIGKTTPPRIVEPNEPYLKDFDQRGFSELTDKYERGETELAAKVAKLSNDVPEMRKYLVPLLREAAAKKSKLLSRQEAILKKYMESASHPTHFFDELPEAVQTALEKVKDQETLPQDVDRWLDDHP